ncbi:MAG: CoA transferase [Ardenticatenaceae bacterium]|nr:CoA transferase [Ardenticatenaceae bacterium]
MGPLSTLKILDFSTLLPGPFATMMLADMGAQVLRVEAPNRPDMVRLMPPFDEEGHSSWHALLNRSKRSLALDLKKPGATAVIKRLVREGGYDIVLEQFRPGVMDRLGVGYEALTAVNPSLIYCSITGYGQTGPYKDRAGHDLNYLALAGVMSHTGRRAGGPQPPGVQVADVGGGSLGAVTGILAAVIHRLATGEGQMVDISMFDMSVAWHSHVVSAYLVGGTMPDYESWGLNGGGFYDCYGTKDGRYLSVGSLEPQFWRGFCTAMGRPDLVERGFEAVPGQMEALKAEIGAVLREKTLAEWTAVFAEYDVCVEPVLTVPEMLQHPQTQARGMVVEVEMGNGRFQPQIASPYKFSRSQPEYKHTGVKTGEHSPEVLRELGYTEAEIAALL